MKRRDASCRVASLGCALLTIAAVAGGALALFTDVNAAPRKPIWAKCPAQGCSAEPCDSSGTPQYTCLNKKTGEFWEVPTVECCCCNQDSKHFWYRGLR